MVFLACGRSARTELFPHVCLNVCAKWTAICRLIANKAARQARVASNECVISSAESTLVPIVSVNCIGATLLVTRSGTNLGAPMLVTRVTFFSCDCKNLTLRRCLSRSYQVCPGNVQVGLPLH